MRITFDTKTKEIKVPYNYAEKLAEINDIRKNAGAEPFSFNEYLKVSFEECMSNTDKNLKVASVPASKRKK